MAKDKKQKVPKDLGVKIGTKEEVFWADVLKKSEEQITQCLREIEIQQCISKFAIKRIDEEKKIMAEKDKA